ncbi:hypothetical protein FOZ63_033066 [Perkinsus olseni]|uniref:Uncharacterized protein n=1 Tax=Perkinsus olseni TaxID=32597 RepID=A0A7J6RWH9_PEROL|nr:hypothetical protein FOZ60_003559 [Perkinsus olseni]KAF4725059.1 hypothetical protein FOZ62_019638 [Perkinsus olseni]KAF4753909.1 hypothetical protein FOZ63_033066 [Perkinsus olseni]
MNVPMLCRTALRWRVCAWRSVSSTARAKCSHLKVVPGLSKPLDTTQTSMVMCERPALMVGGSGCTPSAGKGYCSQHEPRELLKDRLKLVRDQLALCEKHRGKSTKKAEMIRLRSIRLLAMVPYWQSEYLRAIDLSDSPGLQQQSEEASMRAWRMVCETESKENLAELEEEIMDVLKATAQFYEHLCGLVGVEVPADSAEEAG